MNGGTRKFCLYSVPLLPRKTVHAVGSTVVRTVLSTINKTARAHPEDPEMQAIHWLCSAQPGVFFIEGVQGDKAAAAT